MVSSIFKEEGAARLHCSPFKFMAVLYGTCQAIFKSWNQPMTKGPCRHPSMREIRQQQPRGGSLSCKMLKRFSKHRKKPPSIIAQAHASSCSKGCEICDVLCDRWEHMEPNVRLGAITELEELQWPSHGRVQPSRILRPDTYATGEEEERTGTIGGGWLSSQSCGGSTILLSLSAA